VARRIDAAYGHPRARPDRLATGLGQWRKQRPGSRIDLVAHVPGNERWRHHYRDHRENGNYDERFDQRKTAAAHTRQIGILLHLHSLASKECKQFTQMEVRQQSAERPGSERATSPETMSV
jgi:hypothetical protein